MKNSSGAIGAAKAPPYLVSHRRIINVIRIMYPRNSPTSRVADEGRKKGWGIAEGETRIYVVGYIAEIPVGGRERRRRWKREGDGACTKGTPTVPSRSFTPTGAYTLPPQSRSRDRCGATPSPCILHSSLFACTRKREYGSTLVTGRNFRQDTDADRSKI